MSRSYKKHPYCCCEGTKSNKKVANKAVRRALKDFDFDLQYKQYKKVYNSWDIVDFCSNWSFDKFFNCFRHNYVSKEEAYIDWYKAYKRK